MAHPGSGPLQQRGGPRWAPTSPDPPSFVAAVHAAWLAHPPELGADHARRRSSGRTKRAAPGADLARTHLTPQNHSPA